MFNQSSRKRSKDDLKSNSSHPISVPSLFTSSSEDVNQKTEREIGQAVRHFIQIHHTYNGIDDIQIDVGIKQPLIFFLMEKYESISHRHKAYVLSLIEEILNKFPAARSATEGGRNIFFWAIEKGYFELLTCLKPTKKELFLRCYAINSFLLAFKVLDPDQQGTQLILDYILAIVGSDIAQKHIKDQIDKMFKDDFSAAIVEDGCYRESLIFRMQTMVNQNLVTLDDELIHALTSSNICNTLELQLEQGIWIRTISDPIQEEKILEKRENISDEGLKQMRHSVTEQSSNSYTDYSPATFVCSHAHSHLFDTEAGLMIDVGEGPFAYWHDGTGFEMLSKEMDFNQEILNNPENNSKQFSNIAKQDILSYIQSLQEDYVAAVNKNLSAQSIYDAKTNKTLSIPIIFESRGWNEGLLRYKKSHIIGIYIHSDEKQDIINGLRLKHILKLFNIPFFSFSTSTYKFYSIDVEKLIEKHQITPAEWKAISKALELTKNSLFSYSSHNAEEQSILSENESVETENGF